jgi:hypothetical protein
MTEKEAQRQLRLMLRAFTPGSILMLLAEAFRSHAQQYRADDPSGSSSSATLLTPCCLSSAWASMPPALREGTELTRKVQLATWPSQEWPNRTRREQR